MRRADGSGTTFAFTDYLSKVSVDWKSKIGSTVAVEWPTGIGANGNEGVAASVARTKGAIGYVEYVYATQHRLTYTKLINKDGKAVAPATAAFAAAAASADWEATPGFGAILTNQAGENAWPIAAATFVLMHKSAERSRRHQRGVEIFRLGLRQGRQDGRGARLRADAGATSSARCRRFGRPRSRTPPASRSTRSRGDLSRRRARSPGCRSSARLAPEGEDGGGEFVGALRR